MSPECGSTRCLRFLLEKHLLPNVPGLHVICTSDQESLYASFWPSDFPERHFVLPPLSALD